MMFPRYSPDLNPLDYSLCHHFLRQFQLLHMSLRMTSQQHYKLYLQLKRMQQSRASFSTKAAQRPQNL